MLVGGYFLLLPEQQGHDTFDLLAASQARVKVPGWKAAEHRSSAFITVFKSATARMQWDICSPNCIRYLANQKISCLTQPIWSIMTDNVKGTNCSKTALRTWFPPKGVSSEGRAFPRAWKWCHKAAHNTQGLLFLPSRQPWRWGQLQMVASLRDQRDD